MSVFLTIILSSQSHFLSAALFFVKDEIYHVLNTWRKERTLVVLVSAGRQVYLFSVYFPQSPSTREGWITRMHSLTTWIKVFSKYFGMAWLFSYVVFFLLVTSCTFYCFGAVAPGCYISFLSALVKTVYKRPLQVELFWGFTSRRAPNMHMVQSHPQTPSDLTV